MTPLLVGLRPAAGKGPVNRLRQGGGDIHCWTLQVSDKWMDAFLATIEAETGHRDVTYIIALTRAIGTSEERKLLEESAVIKGRFKKKGSDFAIRILTLQEIIDDFATRLREKETPVLEATEMGRLLQLVHAAGLKIVLAAE